LDESKPENVSYYVYSIIIGGARAGISLGVPG
jgi:hypothetical protein